MPLYVFTDREVSTMKVMIDFAVKFAGIQIAKDAVAITAKLNTPQPPFPVDKKET